jgi:hypothetical protein
MNFRSPTTPGYGYQERSLPGFPFIVIDRAGRINIPNNRPSQYFQGWSALAAVGPDLKSRPPMIGYDHGVTGCLDLPENFEGFRLEFRFRNLMVHKISAPDIDASLV